MPAAIASGLPAQRAGLVDRTEGARRFMISARPPNAPTGRPPPMILPSVVRSGVIFSISWTPPRASRKPVITSSKISTAPCACREPGRTGGSRFRAG